MLEENRRVNGSVDISFLKRPGQRCSRGPGGSCHPLGDKGQQTAASGHSQHQENLEKCVAVKAVVVAGGEIPFPDVHHRGKILLFPFNWKAENE